MNKLLLGVLLLAGGTALHSCSDEWDDHYSDSGSNAVNSTGISLWDRLKSMPDYSAFVEKLQEYDYDRILSQNRAFTVYAPNNAAMANYVANGQYNEKDAFVRNHIAYFNHPYNTYADTTVEMMNEKVMRIRGGLFGTNQDPNIAFVEGETNLPCRNGLIHGISGIVPYMPNIWEIIDAQAPLYSQYLHQLDEQVLNTEESTVDSISSDGQTVYLDSVVTYNNNFWSVVGELNTEDSSYVSIVMADDAWQAAYSQIEKSYLYYPALQGGNFWEGAGNTQSQQDSLSRYKDAMIYQTIMRSLSYRYPQVESLLEGNYRPDYDFISSTSGRQVPKEVLKAWLEKIAANPDSVEEASNGRAYIAHSYDFANYDVAQDTISTEAENSQRIFQVSSGASQSTVRLNTDTLSYSTYQPEEELNNVEYYVPKTLPDGTKEKHEVSSSEYLMVGAGTAAPSIIFGVPNTLSGEYEVWITFIPSSAARGASQALPANIRVTTQYTTLRSESSLALGTTRTDDFPVDARAVTKVKVGTINLGACWSGFMSASDDLYTDATNITGSDLFNSKYGVKITVQNRSSSNGEYDRNLYIDCIELVPHRVE
ncbi:MAG: fasciclin domain-containing protein [Bacteroidaceae bacterium]|jgi:hypothetical protein